MSFSAGFPVVQGASGGSQVGDQALMSELGQLYVKPNGEEWLRSGSTISSAGYAQAAAIDYLKTMGTAGTQTTPMSAYVGVATDGAGRFVAAYANNTNVLVSTDYGATWALVAHNAGGTITDVVWDSKDSLFVCAGNTTVLFLTSSQTAASVGSAWTARTGSVIVGGTADTARIKQSAAETVMVCRAGTTGNASRSTNGTTWTAANFITGISNTTMALISLGSSIWIAIDGGTTTYQRSTDGGATWANATLPASCGHGAAGNGLCVISDTSGNMYTSSTGATGSWTSIGAVLGSGSSVSKLIYDGVRFLVTAAFGSASGAPVFFYSTNGALWKTRGITNKSWANSSTIGGIGSDGTNIVFLPSSTSGVVYGNFDEGLRIGLPQLSALTNTATYPPMVNYVRIK